MRFVSVRGYWLSLNLVYGNFEKLHECIGTRAESWEIQPRKLLDVNRFGQKLVLWRDRPRQTHCLSDQCLHRGGSLEFSSRMKLYSKHLLMKTINASS